MFNDFIQALNFAANITLPSIFMLIFGYFLNRLGQIDRAFCHQASKIMFNWALPALLFFSIIESNIIISQQLKLVLAGGICALILFLGAEIAAYFLIKKQDRGVFVQGIYRGNTAIIGLAFCVNAYGQEGLSVGAIFTGTMTFLYNILAVITLTRSLEKSSQNIWSILVKIIKNPLIISIILAFCCRFLNIKIPATLSQSGHYLSATALPLALICIGATFDVKSIIRISDFSLWTSIARVIIAPAIALVIGLLFGLKNIEFGVLFLMYATPVAAAAYVMVKAMGGNDISAANIVGITSILSMFTASLWLTILRYIHLM